MATLQYKIMPQTVKFDKLQVGSFFTVNDGHVWIKLNNAYGQRVDQPGVLAHCYHKWNKPWDVKEVKVEH